MSQTASNILDHINSPDDLKKLDVKQLPQVCDELRRFIINALSCNPGTSGRASAWSS